MAAVPELRRTFDASAATYHDARPSYPGELFDDLGALLPPHPDVLEVGPGTGQATEPMLDRGANIWAVELGPALANALTERLADAVETGALEVGIGDFEQLEPALPRFDAVVSATAYHWISAAEQLARPPRWLRPGGRLAVIDTNQVASGLDRGFFEASSSIYLRHGQRGATVLPTPEDVVPAIHDRMVAAPSCHDVTLHRYRADQRYDAAGYRRLLNTYSGMLAMSVDAREALIDELVELVDQMGGWVVRPLVITLATCRFTT